jgi:anti-sigma B factor antagonist
MMPVGCTSVLTALLLTRDPLQDLLRGRGGIVDLSLSENTIDSQVIVEVRGEVDVHSAPQLRDRLTQVIDGGNKSVVVDLTRLAFIDSTGLGALVAALNHAKSTDAALRVVCSSERLLKLFRITGLHEVFSIFPTVPQAVAAGTLPSSTS